MDDSSRRKYLPLVLFAAAVWWAPPIAWAQPDRTTDPDVGIRSSPPTTVAIVNANLVVRSGQQPEPGSLVFQNGRILTVGLEAELPPSAKIIDCEGDYLIPAFVDPMVEVELRELESSTKHWNPQVRSEVRTDQLGNWSEELFDSLRKAGIAVALAAPKEGIIKGTSCVVTTHDARRSTQILRDQAFQHVRLYPSRRAAEYPNSPMGAVALVRQTLSDADWYQRARQAAEVAPGLSSPEFNSALEALVPTIRGNLPVVIDGSNELYAMRADRLAREFSLRLVIRGSGREYRRLAALKQTNRTLMVPVDFPDAPAVTSEQEIADATLQQLMHWRLAPENPARLSKAGIDFVLTSDQLADRSDYLEKIREAIARGLSPESALAALTERPAELLQVESLTGSLEPGKLANFLRFSGPWFESDSKLKETWIAGQRFPVEKDKPAIRFHGSWTLELDQAPLSQLELHIDGRADEPTAQLRLPRGLPAGAKPEEDPTETEPTVKPENAEGKPENAGGKNLAKDNSGKSKEKNLGSAELSKLTFTDFQWSGKFSVAPLSESLSGVAVISATLLQPKDQSPTLQGTVRWPDGRRSDFSATWSSPSPTNDVETQPAEDLPESAQDTQESSDPSLDLKVNYPLGAFGRMAAPESFEWILFKGATLWTCGDQGTLDSADLLVHNGIIHSVGSNLKAPDDAKIIDATGLHISPGIIDCHSHMATDGGVNESGQAVTAEVRIGDFIDPDDINIYRQLAGGVTTSNILHGSANPIGGQNQVIKLRWGDLDEAMKMRQAPGGIKFALGENVKQANRGDQFRTRYPQTRMGVEQIMRDRFEAALQYGRQWSQWNRLHQGLPPRKDYELEAILEILRGDRWIHCHSYRQDEILTMLRTLEDYNVTIGSLQHILEGYKVADAMAAHGATGSSFSDWWAYKFEVYDAIPYNGAVMHRAGVVVSFNSDDRELARHLNHEAAKAMKYGGISPEEALKFVTLNPAKQLRIDAWVGSLEPGKHADLVLWNRAPLSTLSVCQQTWIDGRKYFDRQEDLEQQAKDRDLHQTLVQTIIDSGATTGKRQDKNPSNWWARHDEFCHHSHGDEDDHQN